MNTFYIKLGVGIVLAVASLLVGFFIIADNLDTNQPSESKKGSCEGRCGNNLDKSFTCQCNDKCTKFKDCCHDYSSLCSEGKSSSSSSSSSSNAPPGGKCQSLSNISQELWDRDVDRVPLTEFKVDYQGSVVDGTAKDSSSESFFKFVNESALDSPIYKTYIALLDNYHPAKYEREEYTSSDRLEMDNFLDALLETDTIKALYQYLLCRGKVADLAEFRTLLDKTWFTLYPRSGSSQILDTSAFEHVMVCEWKSKTKANGCHSWLALYLLEKQNTEGKEVFDYYGHYPSIDPTNLAAIAFNWEGRVKQKASIFLRASPAYDIAIYTICFVEYKGRNCPISLNGHALQVQTYATRGTLMATAFVRA